MKLKFKPTPIKSTLGVFLVIILWSAWHNAKAEEGVIAQEEFYANLTEVKKGDMLLGYKNGTQNGNSFTIIVTANKPGVGIKGVRWINPGIPSNDLTYRYLYEFTKEGGEVFIIPKKDVGSARSLMISVARMYAKRFE